MARAYVAGAAVERTSVAKTPSAGFTLGGASEELVPANESRVALYVTAPAASITLRFGTGTVVAGQGIVVSPNTTQKFTEYTGAVQVIGTAAQVAGVVEV
jgi:hypothetical protein